MAAPEVAVTVTLQNAQISHKIGYGFGGSNRVRLDKQSYSKKRHSGKENGTGP